MSREECKSSKVECHQLDVFDNHHNHHYDNHDHAPANHDNDDGAVRNIRQSSSAGHSRVNWWRN